ncbi:hypothetical protein LBK6_00480 [Leptospira borgpetersenii serovar Hardjo]|nr:hypothetical protein LBK6_00480 [Leptospira borgpetersenii serovar Hardjo]AWV68852.1 hypothetical protein B9T54_00545 [Leptospira borgpetersenii serovar Hardjo-bovis]TQE51833.1 hypothetical protein FFZ95_12805 [Leptospira borgpetersenii]AMX60157.1 hypothetical protein LBK9_00480 [Leptospira borgpetersenii serovar Hardjo]AMX63404.1 hypothetical protein LBK30_00485 [Leptospira borgpetersenii serovar Hardjo]
MDLEPFPKSAEAIRRERYFSFLSIGKIKLATKTSRFYGCSTGSYIKFTLVKIKNEKSLTNDIYRKFLSLGILTNIVYNYAIRFVADYHFYQ